MTVLELQKSVADALNGAGELVQGGCRAFAEDVRSVYDEAAQWVAEGGVALVVLTPEMERDGADARGIPAGARVQVQCSESPAVASGRPGVMRALDAAEAVMHGLDSASMRWLSTRQVFDPRSGVLTATATFATSVMLTKGN